MVVGDVRNGPQAQTVAPSRKGLGDFAALVVEDNVLIAMDAEEVLRDLGASEVTICASVATALACIAATRFDVALLDVSLGDETSEAIAQVLQARETPFIMTTGFGDFVSDIAAYAGAPLLTKPYTAAVLAEALTAALGRIRDSR